MYFPREMWAGSHIQGAINPPRLVVNNKEEYSKFIRNYNGRMNVYTSVYDFEYFSNNRGLEHTIILDRLFLDFDAHDGELQEAFEACNAMHIWLKAKDIKHNMAFSGRGFYIFVYGERTHSLRRVKAFFNICHDVVNKSPTLDNRVINNARLRRVFNSYHMIAQRYCITIDTVDMMKGLDWILEISDRPSKYEPVYYGEKLVEWPEVKQFDAVEIEIDSVESPGSLPILPCLLNACMVENPNHRARVLLVQWYNEVLSELTVLDNGLSCQPREVSGQVLNNIKASIEKEINTIASNDDVWIDYNAYETRKHVGFIVDKRYMSPSCSTLIEEGFCVGKCWRYSEE